MSPRPAPPPGEILRGDRVVLRSPRAADRREYLALREASREHLAPWEPTPPPGLDTFGPQVFDRLLASAAAESSRRFLICLHDGTIVGQVSLNGIVRGAFQSCTAGYWVGAAFAGRGYMREALSLAVTHAFRDMGLHRVEANIIPQNRASKALVKSLGFRFEGLAKNYLSIAGRWRDHERWSMTSEEWPGTAGAHPRGRPRDRARAARPTRRAR